MLPAAGAGSSGQADDAPRSDKPFEEEGGRVEEAGPSPRNELEAAAAVGVAHPLCAWPGQLTSIVWLRRDLRMDDNPALNAALKTGGNVVSL
jgi:hypothetical protein